MGFATRIIHTPAGACPVKLKSTEHDDVLEWAQLVMEKGQANNLNYLPNALVFFAQQFYNIFSEEYKLVKSHLCDIFQINLNEELINKVNQEKNIVKEENDEEPKKKRRGRPPKKQYSPSQAFRTEVKESESLDKKYQPKRK